MSNKTRPTRDYDVGRGTPPVHSQFKPGQSGNAHGHPKGSLDHRTILLTAINERVEVVENGRRRKQTEQEVTIINLVNKAAKGDHRSTELMFKEVNRIEHLQAKAATATPDESTEYGTPDDERLFAATVKRLRGEV